MAIPPQFAKFIATKSNKSNPLQQAAAARLASKRTKKRPKKKKAAFVADTDKDGA